MTLQGSQLAALIPAPKVVSTLPQNRVEQQEVQFPAGWEVHYVADYEGEFSEEMLAEACRDADFLLCIPYPRITRSLIQKLPKLKMIQMAGVGYDRVDLEAAAEAGIVVANSPGVNSTTVAEFTIACAIILQRRLLEADQGVKQGQYAPVREALLREGLGELAGSCFGLIGLGNIGREVARLARAHGAEVVYYTPTRKPAELEAGLGVSYRDFGELLATADIVSLHLPLTKETHHLIGVPELQQMKPSALLINTSRGGLVDEVALIQALAQGEIAGAAIDTFSTEPLPADHPFLHLPEEVKPRLLLTPHLAGVSRQAFTRMLRNAIENMARVARGEPARFVVNGVSLPRRT